MLAKHVADAITRMGALPSPLPLARIAETKKPLGRLLVERGVLTLEQLEEALTEKETSGARLGEIDRKSTRLNSSHTVNSYAVFCLKKKNSYRYYESQSARLCRHLTPNC